MLHDRPRNNSGRLRDVRRNPPSFVPSEHIGRSLPSRLILEIEVGEFASVEVFDDEASLRFFDGPGRGEAVAPELILTHQRPSLRLALDQFRAIGAG